MKNFPLIFNNRDELVRVDLSKTVYFEAMGNYVNITFINGHTVMVLSSLLNIEKQFSNKIYEQAGFNFARIGKRFIINCQYITQINIQKQELVLSDLISPNVYVLNISKEALKKLKSIYNKK